MSEEIKEDEAPEEEPREDAEEGTASGEQEEKPVKIRKKSGKKIWIFIIPVLILAIPGLAIKYAPEHFSFLMKKDFQTPEVSIDEDNLSEEVLSPFFIPPGADDAIRIDLSIVWDGLAAIRYRKRELYLRSKMYDKFYEVASQNPDMNTKIPDMENEVSSMLRSSLGVRNLAVKIKEIRYF